MGHLPRLSVDEATVDRVTAALDAEGCAVVERFLPDAKVTALRAELEPHRQQTPLGRNDFPPFLGYVDGRHPRRALAGDRDTSTTS